MHTWIGDSDFQITRGPPIKTGKCCFCGNPGRIGRVDSFHRLGSKLSELSEAIRIRGAMLN